MKLYEIDEGILSCIDTETGEILDFDKLNALQMERESKIENVACWIKDLKAEAEALKGEKQAFDKRQKAVENKIESLEKWLIFALAGENFKTTKAVVSFRKSQKVDIPDIYKLDENFLKYAEPTADRTAIKKAIKEGQTVEGATLVESVSVSVK